MDGNWILLGLVAWVLCVLFVLVLMRMVDREDRAACNAEKNLTADSDVTITAARWLGYELTEAGWLGYERELIRGFRGQRFGTSDEHEFWLTLAADGDASLRERGRGDRDGLDAATAEEVA
jgi:hypothetical protein